MAYTLRFPITLQDEVTGVTRQAKANEIEFGIDCTGQALTEFPRDKAAGVIWFETGAVVVKKMYPWWCPSPIPSCEPTEPLEAGKQYVGSVSWMANKAYRKNFDIYLAESETTKTVPLTLVVPSVAPPPNGDGDGDGNGDAGATFDRIIEWIKAHPAESVGIGVATYLLVGRK